MPKTWVVLLPLLLAATVAVVAAWRGRRPTRAGLNVAVALLLLVYVATTASLGVFWVANQQLPVFDWHYLFGYATLLLLVAHLALNWRAVWQVLRRRGTPAARGPRARRPALALLAVGAAAGAGYALGLRHGRTELQVVGATPGGDADVAREVVERYHAFSSHTRAGLLRRAPGEWGGAPPPFKSYPGAARLALVRTAAPGPAPDAAVLGALLWHTAGVAERRGAVVLRTSPSAGALFATELYVAVLALPGVAPGLWHHDAASHALERLAAEPPDAASLGLPDGALGGAAAVVVASAVFARSGHKYRDRTYRYVLADLGHALENLRAAAAALGARADLPRHFDEARIAATLGVDEATEGVLAVALLRPAGAGDPGDAGRWRVPALADADRVALTAAVHRATSLRLVAPQRGAALPLAAAPAPAATGAGWRRLPPPSPAARADTLSVIGARRSQRRFAATPLALADLAGVLAATAAPPLLSPAVRVDVVAHAVESLPAGAWRYMAHAHALAPRAGHDAAALRATSRAVALAQDVVGDAAAVLVLSIDSEGWQGETTGAARGWRLAFVEAGVVGERVYLAAGARGLGACAVGAFYDDEAAALVGADPRREWVVHLAALGVPRG